MREVRSGLLDGKDEIRKFLRNASDYKLRKWIQAGMPVLIDDGRWLAHQDNLEDFFRKYTRVNSRDRILNHDGQMDAASDFIIEKHCD